jgi:hypothetical protein
MAVSCATEHFIEDAQRLIHSYRFYNNAENLLWLRISQRGSPIAYIYFLWHFNRLIEGHMM